MLNVHFCRPDEIPDAQLRFAVIAARQDGEWIFCRHRLRSTWELPGGHRERGETIDETARRELNEETGAAAFDLHPIALYGVEQNGDETFGALYFAEVCKIEPLDPASEIGEIRRASVFPTDWTYPEIQPRLLRRIQEWLNLQTGADELWDLLDEDGNPTGKTHRRGDPLAPGEMTYWNVWGTIHMDTTVTSAQSEELFGENGPYPGGVFPVLVEADAIQAEGFANAAAAWAAFK